MVRRIISRHTHVLPINAYDGRKCDLVIKVIKRPQSCPGECADGSWALTYSCIAVTRCASACCAGAKQH